MQFQFKYRNFIVLAVVVALLVVSSAFAMRRVDRRTIEDLTQLDLQATSLARSQYIRSRNGKDSGAGSDYSKAIISDLKKIANTTNSRIALRRLAIVQNWQGDKDWVNTVLKLKSAVDTVTNSNEFRIGVESEMAMWGAIFNSRVNPQDLNSFQNSIRSMNLGWYKHLALIKLFKATSQTEAAEREDSLAIASSIKMVMLQLFAFVIFLGGITFWILYSALKKYVQSEHPNRIPPFLLELVTPKIPMPTIVGHQRVLYYTFVTYLVTIAALRIILTAVSWVLSSNTLGLNNPLYSTALNMSLSFAPPVVAFIYWVKNRPSDLTLANIGLSRKNIIQDMICGVVGYMAFLPIMVLTVYVSQMLLKGFNTPTNPAITFFTSTRNPYFHLMIVGEAVIMAPIIEEIMFRGVFYNSLKNDRVTLPAMIVSSFVFAILHPQLPLGFPGIFALGMMFTALTRHRQSIIPGMVAHAINNGAIFVFLMLSYAD